MLHTLLLLAAIAQSVWANTFVVDHEDPLIGYELRNAWSVTNTTLVLGSETRTVHECAGTCGFQFHFRGSSVAWYGYQRGLSPNGSVTITVDGRWKERVELPGRFSPSRGYVWNRELRQGDHVVGLYGDTVHLIVDHFVVESAEERLPRISTPFATVLPADTVAYDAIVGSPEHGPSIVCSGMWSAPPYAMHASNNTSIYFTERGAVTVTFFGSAIWWFGRRSPYGGSAIVRIDDEEDVDLIPTRDESLVGELHQQLIWSRVALPLGLHTLTIESPPGRTAGGIVEVDFLRILEREWETVSDEDPFDHALQQPHRQTVLLKKKREPSVELR